jgi:dTMP kinase
MVLITIEGIDGSGKSSLIASLKENLQDLCPVFTREPGSTWIGDQVRRAVAEEMDPVTEALLFTADHAAHVRQLIRPCLQAGKLVVSDRYSDSRYAYQPALLEGIIDQPLEWLRALHDGWTIPPDKTFLFVLPVSVAHERMREKGKREHLEHPDLLLKVQKNYLALAEAEPSRFVLVDATKERDELSAFVAGSIRDFYERSRSRRRR